MTITVIARPADSLYPTSIYFANYVILPIAPFYLG